MCLWPVCGRYVCDCVHVIVYMCVVYVEGVCVRCVWCVYTRVMHDMYVWSVCGMHTCAMCAECTHVFAYVCGLPAEPQALWGTSRSYSQSTSTQRTLESILGWQESISQVA